MTQSFADLWIHLIFSTQHREPFLAERRIREAVFAYLVGICKNLNSPAMIAGGIADHVHILFKLSKQITVVDLVKKLKQDSSKWIKREFPNLNHFYWQKGYGAFTVGPLQKDKVYRYIANQEEHHKQLGSQEELAAFLKKYKVPYEEKYL